MIYKPVRTRKRKFREARDPWMLGIGDYIIFGRRYSMWRPGTPEDNLYSQGYDAAESDPNIQPGQVELK